ncbi:MAG TPA: ATP-binding protein [Pyrinomonadaceae bacterium]|jgi:PAS domain S-box-containing protein
MSDDTTPHDESKLEPQARRRGAPWLLGGLVLALLCVLLAQQVFGLWEFVTPDTASDTLILYALSSLNFVAFVVFAFIFVRNLLKLRRERRARVLGSKIKTRLVVYFITVSLLPITAMAVFSYFFFNRTLEKMFGRLPEDVVREAKLARAEDLQQRTQGLREATQLTARALDLQLARGETPDWPRLLAEGNFAALGTGGADGLGDVDFHWREGTTFYESKELVAALKTANWRAQSDAQTRLPLLTAAGLIADAAPLADGRMLVAVRASQTNPRLDNIVSGAERFEELRRGQRRIRMLGLTTLGLLTLLLLFAVTWAAIHLARGFATPIRALAEASDEVARGNLAHRVTAPAEDELALLAASFNQMTAQLAENRARIEAGATELRDKNLALAERRNYIETVLESLSTGVVSLDEQNRVTTINAAALLMLRLAAAPTPGTPLGEITTPEDRIILERVLLRARRTGRAAWQMELARAVSPEGAGLPVALTATALGQPASAPRGVVIVIEDLSELLAAQRAAAWSEVARRMAHEIKNPLTPIQLSAERIARHVAARANGNGQTPTDERAERERVARVVAECTATITREVAGLKAMVDEFSRFARLPHARPAPADLNEIARQAVALYEDRLDGVRLDVRLAHALPLAMLDAEQMRRVLVNLIDNALEATSDPNGAAANGGAAEHNGGVTGHNGGAGPHRVTVATGHDPARGLLLVEVADTGHGIASADFPRLFQPYFSTRGRGTGLGLAIVQRIVADHGGRIRAEANRPRGARFIIELPVTDEVQKPEARSQKPEEDKPAEEQPLTTNH